MLKGLVWVFMSCYLTTAMGQEGKVDKRQLIDELIELTQVKQVVPSLSDFWAHTVIQTLSKHKPINNEQQQDILSATYLIVDHKLIENNMLLDIVYPFYNDRFSQQELSRLVTFYRSPVGMKSIHYMPIDHTELQQFIQQHQGGLQTEIAEQVQDMIETTH